MKEKVKPTKILYEDQKELWEKASSYILKLIKNQPCVKEAYIWASLAEGQFGIYEEEYQGRLASDIDLVIVLNENESIPKSWKYLHVEKSWFKLYKLGIFEYKGNAHPIDGLLVSPSIHDIRRMKEMLDRRSKRLM